MVSFTLSILPSTSVNKYNPITIKAQYHANELFAIGREENNKYFFAKYLKFAKRKKKR